MSSPASGASFRPGPYLPAASLSPLYFLADGVRAQTRRDAELVAEALRARGRKGDAKRASRILGCAVNWQAVALACGGCGTSQVRQAGICHLRECPSCYDRNCAEARQRVAENLGAQPWTGELVSTLPRAPWVWCPFHELESSPDCLEELEGLPKCPGAHWRTRELYTLDFWGAWATRIRAELDRHWRERHGLLVGYYLWPHTRGKRRTEFHPHANVVFGGLGYRPDDWSDPGAGGELVELPGHFECRKGLHKGCAANGGGHAGPKELEHLKRAMLRAAMVPWSHRGKGPHYTHAPNRQTQAHRIRYVFRHPSTYEPGRVHDPRHRVEDIPPRTHLLVPGGVFVGRKNGAELKRRYLELRPPLEEADRVALAHTCTDCGESTWGADRVIFDESQVLAVQVAQELIDYGPGWWHHDGLLAIPRGPPKPDPEAERIGRALLEDRRREAAVRKRRQARRDAEFLEQLELKKRELAHTEDRLRRLGIDPEKHRAELEAARLEERRAAASRSAEELAAETARLDREGEAWLEETRQRLQRRRAGLAGETREDKEREP